MKKGKQLVRCLMACILMAGIVMTTQATGLYDQQQDLENQRNELKEEHKSLEVQVQELTTSMQQTEAEIQTKELEIEQTEEELLQAKIEQNHQYEGMKLRMQYMYENGNENFMQVLIESENIMDFFTKTEYILTMSQYDRKKLDEFTNIVYQVEEQEAMLKAEYDGLAALRASLESKRQEAEALLREKAAELEKLDTKLDDIRTLIQQSQYNSGITGEDDGWTAQEPVISGNGQFAHPCPGYVRISSTFGEVRNGVNDPNAHKGVDMAAAAKTPVYAADAGKVLYARWSNTAGYWVVIDHGGGLVTKYMHMYKMPFVTEGQRVQKGQHIGGVGNTGNSFGNHLHFQVEINGRAVNPLKYL